MENGSCRVICKALTTPGSTGLLEDNKTNTDTLAMLIGIEEQFLKRNQRTEIN